jgi:hypothetical protein
MRGLCPADPQTEKHIMSNGTKITGENRNLTIPAVAAGYSSTNLASRAENS